MLLVVAVALSFAGCSQMTETSGELSRISTASQILENDAVLKGKLTLFSGTDALPLLPLLSMASHLL